jgi:hypothetical protein
VRIEKDYHTPWTDYFNHPKIKIVRGFILKKISKKMRSLNIKASWHEISMLNEAVAKSLSVCQQLPYLPIVCYQKIFGHTELQVMRIQEMLRLFDSNCERYFKATESKELLMLLTLACSFADLDNLTKFQTELHLHNKKTGEYEPIKYLPYSVFTIDDDVFNYFDYSKKYYKQLRWSCDLGDSQIDAISTLYKCCDIKLLNNIEMALPKLFDDFLSFLKGDVNEFSNFLKDNMYDTAKTHKLVFVKDLQQETVLVEPEKETPKEVLEDVIKEIDTTITISATPIVADVVDISDEEVEEIIQPKRKQSLTEYINDNLNVLNDTPFDILSNSEGEDSEGSYLHSIFVSQKLKNRFGQETYSQEIKFNGHTYYELYEKLLFPANYINEELGEFLNAQENNDD